MEREGEQTFHEPYRPGPQEIEALRSRLHERGFRFELAEEEKASLLEREFRNLEKGRGPGVVAVMGREKAEGMLQFALEVGRRAGGKRIVSDKTGQPIERTEEGRGVQQAAADILTIAVWADSPEGQEAVRRLNRRLWRGLERIYQGKPEMEAIDQTFAEYIEPPPTLKLASVTPQALKDVFNYLLGESEDPRRSH